jgi:hypothetical protein
MSHVKLLKLPAQIDFEETTGILRHIASRQMR